MKPLNIYMCGVGGQGIGLLAHVVTLACIGAGYKVRGCDTHGLAQRHGTVSSHLRLGEDAYTPRVSPGRADLVLGLERLEALRGIRLMLKPGGTAIYYDVAYQPISVRVGSTSYPTTADIESAVMAYKGRLERVYDESLVDPRMQNVALLGRMAVVGPIDGVTPKILEDALTDTLPSNVREANLELFRRVASI